MSFSKSFFRLRTVSLWTLPLALTVALFGCSALQNNTPRAQNAVTSSTFSAVAVPFKVVASFPHDRAAFTEGFLWHNGALYEGTGLKGKSQLRKVDLESGKVLQMRHLSDDIFGEGIAIENNRVTQLSWQAQRAFHFDLETFKSEGETTYRGEGWGMTFDGKNFIMSNGSEYLVWRDPKDFSVTRRLQVTFNGKPLQKINELEWINGEVWANVWQTDYIVRIDPQSGRVTSYLDCSDLLSNKWKTGGEDVLNGIAYDKATGRIFLTGKFWPRVFEIKLTT